jgi:cytochrome c oxidase cbb3-type subunit III
VPEDQVLSFDLIYKTHCAGCHGATGRLGPAPPLNDSIFLAIAPDKELVRVIREGRPGTPMPAFARDKGGPLTDPQLEVLAAGIKPRWRTSQPTNEPLPAYSVADRGASAGDKDRGDQVFARACAHCHGDSGEGGEYRDRRIGAINDPAFLALISDQALRRYAITGRPDLGMPDYAGRDGRAANFQALSSPEITDLVALLSSWRQQESLSTR